MVAGAWTVGTSIIKRGVANKDFTEACVDGSIALRMPLLQGSCFLSNLDELVLSGSCLGLLRSVQEWRW